MQPGIFATVAVAVDFEAAGGGDDDPRLSRRIEIRPGHALRISAATEDALALAARLAARGRIRLVHATPPLTHLGIEGPGGAWFPADTAGELERMAKAESTAILRKLGELYCPGIELDTHVVAGPPALVILTDLRKRPVDAIVLGVSGHRRLHRAFLGSTADKVIRRAPCPVIVMPQPVGD
jgi:nucleotide-binding universal stress UspA family protein